MDTTLHLLLVEDSEDDAALLERELRRSGFAIASERVDTAEAMTAALARKTWDLVISDYALPAFSAPAALRLLKASGLDLPFIIVSGKVGDYTAVAAMKAGAQDYVMKGNLVRLAPVIEREVREAAERREHRKAQEILSLTQQQLRIAREIQQSLFPKTSPSIPGLDVAGASCPADDTGGDYFDFIQMADDRLGIVVGDVSGHGLGPALLMVGTRGYLRTLAQTYSDVSAILKKANALLCNDFAVDQFVTLFFAHVDPKTRRLLYASAGHTAGHVLDKSGNVKVALESTAFPCGLNPDFDFPTAPPVQLDAGDLVLLPTDGVLEARSPRRDLFGEERTLDIVRRNRQRSSREIVDALHKAVLDFTETEAQRDDITAVVLRITGE